MKNTIMDKVSDSLSNVSEDVNKRVVDVLVERDKEKRVNAIVAGLNKIDELTKKSFSLNKGDQVSYNEDGTVASATFSKERLVEKNKNKEILEKWTSAVDKAISKGDMSKLYDMVK